MRVASIDIGTNTILMMIGDLLPNKNIEIIKEEFSIARLGEGVDKTDVINDNAIKRATEILDKYKTICNELNVVKIKTVATSAMRDANNKDKVLSIFEDILKFKVDIISGAQEAEYSFIGTVKSNLNSMVIDIGGGSTEIISGENYNVIDKISLNMGTVRVTEKFFKSQPPDIDSIILARDFIKNELSKISFTLCNKNCYAVAGIATTLATAVAGIDDNLVYQIHEKTFSTESIKNVVFDMLTLTSNEIIQKYKINPKRADLISAGGLILTSIFDTFNINEVIVSSYGLRYGVLKSTSNQLF